MFLGAIPREGSAMSAVTVRWVSADGTAHLAEGDTAIAAPAEAVWSWIDLTSPSEETLKLLGEHHGLHALALEDTRHDQLRPKLDAYGEWLFLVWITPRHPDGDGLTTEELDVFVGRTTLITVHNAACTGIDKVASDLAHSMHSGPDWLLHAIIDRLVDDTLPLIDQVGEQLETIEDAMLDDSPRQDDLRDLHTVRRRLVRLHRIVAPERDVLRSLARESDIISEDAYRYFQDVGDHVARAQDAIETYQDVGASVMDVYLSAQSNRMNEIMKQLTVVATIFMPLTLISGIYGMNVLAGMWPPPLAPWSFAAVIAVMGVIAITMAVFFRKRNWW
jgi:magnesium transporter